MDFSLLYPDDTANYGKNMSTHICHKNYKPLEITYVDKRRNPI